MMTLDQFMKEQMEDPEFASAYKELQPEMSVIRALIDARTSQNLTQKELSERTGIAQTEISKLERARQEILLLNYSKDLQMEWIWF